MTEQLNDKGTCELVIYCHKCKKFWQLNPEMIAVSLVSNANVWDVYNYILTTDCVNCNMLGEVKK